VVALEVRQGTNTLGTIKMVLRPDKAPLSVANFLEYLRAGHYEGTIFHRVMPDFMIQGGGFTPEMEEKPERPPIRNEARNRLRNSRGAVSMARTEDPHSAAAQFFINARNNHNLDFGIAGMGYAVFGHVIEGMEVVDLISTTPTTRRGEHENTPVMPVVIERADEVEAAAPAPGPGSETGVEP
jgi:cyclophilin family peptidyl-prolyl cis-trans isomerase